MKLLRTVFLGLVMLAAIAAAAFFIFGPGYFENQYNRIAPNVALPEVSAQTQELHDALFIADLHADTLLWKRPLTQEGQRGHTDLPRMRAGGFELQVFSAVTRVPSGQNYEHNEAQGDSLRLLSFGQLQPFDTWFSPLGRALFQAKKLERAAERDGNLRIIRTQADLTAVNDSYNEDGPMVGGILALEGMHAMEGEAENRQKLWDAGYRMGGLHHFFDNELGGSLHGVSEGGLSEFGRETVAAMLEQGWIIDLTHSSPAVVNDVLALAPTVLGRDTDLPLVVSHTGFKGYCNRTRNIDDALMIQIARAGGIIGQGFWMEAACGQSEAPANRDEPAVEEDITVELIAGSVAYGIALLDGAGLNGDEHIALGSDFDGAVMTPFDASQMNVLTQALLDEGLTEFQVRNIMGANARSFFADHLPGE